MAIKLRKKAPFTCRFTVAGKLCAAYLTETDGDFCQKCEAARQRFIETPVVTAKKQEQPQRGQEKFTRIWP